MQLIKRLRRVAAGLESDMVMKKVSINAVAAVLCAVAGAGLRNANAQQADAQPAAPTQTNRLVTGRLVYVAPMPDQLDKWLQSDLEQWGKYKVTSNSEGVDLEIRAIVPDQEPRYKERHGVPLPKQESKDKPREDEIDIVDWTTGARLWTVTLLDKKVDHNAPPPTPGPSLEVRAHGMTADQLALKLTGELRRYVEQLQGSAPN
ncbi:MAG TPA: hypothetical protein VMT20_26890 [Terriglobia bacterium]|nr:hypothetical protein [Terriglobia bacterium]